jgi:hypothetical protein
MKLTGVALVLCCTVAFAGPLAAQETKPSENKPSDAQVAPKQWIVEKVRCSDILNAAEDDRASAMMFYYGYLAAKAQVHVVDTQKIEGIITKVMKHCEAMPTITVTQAFRSALSKNGSPR